ncbi:MAG: LacI family DNA-binding transcriptional regulator [Spirochaetales bacterium]|nr:LacI family DNA-binding transcriptional regulator [Spirochaetales bacterium]
MPLTIKDIARIAGVSHSTVSRGLNGKPGVSDELRDKIKQIASDLGFEFNANARSLSTAKTGTIGIIYDEENYESTLHIYSMGLLRYMRNSLEREDLDAIITFSKNRFTGYDNIEKLINKRKVDGLIIISSKIDIKTIHFLNDAKIPFVFSHQIPDENFGDVDSVYCDHFNGGYIAGGHLIKQGCRKLLCIARKDNRKEFQMRTAGFTSAARDSGLEIDKQSVITGGYTFIDGYNTAIANLDRIKKSDGIFIHTDLKALGVISALSERNISVPDDICVIGYDDTELCTFIKPSLTSIQQPSEKIAVQTCERLIELLNGSREIKTKKIILPPRLIERDSSNRKIRN